MMVSRHLFQLVANDDDRISRTQCMIWIAFFLAVALVTAHVLRGGGAVLDASVLWVLLGMGVFLSLDRMGARFISLKFGNLHVQASAREAANGCHTVDTGNLCGPGNMDTPRLLCEPDKGAP